MLSYVLNNIYSHLDKPEFSIHVMFYDFSSAFNTIQLHILADKLMDYNMHASTVLWVLDYLTNRPQFVKLTDNVKSDVICTNTGAPQGTALSPFFFSVYTADCRSFHTDCVLVKYADDTALAALIKDDDDTHTTDRKSIVLYSGVERITLTYMLVRQKRWLLTFGARSAGLNLHRLFSGGGEIAERVETYL